MAHQNGAITRNRSAKDLSIISTFQSKPLYHSEEFLRQKYLVERLSTRQIAREIRSARSTVKEAIKGFGIPLRPGEEARQLNKGQLAFGEKLVRGIVMPHGGERRVLRRMVELRDRGDSFGKIAEWLNAKGVPTKGRAHRWNRPAVFKILNRHAT